MTPAQFRLLYINANLIAELALQRFALAEPGQGDGAPAAAQSEDFGSLDLSALDGLDELVQQHMGTLDAGSAEETQGDDVGYDVDLDTQLSRAYADSSISDAYAAQLQRQADEARLDALLALLPHPMPSLVSALTGGQLEEWLEIYRRQHDALDELIVTLRSLGAAGRW